MLKWKTLDYEEIDLLLSKKSLDALQKYRDDNEKKRKQSTGKIFYNLTRSGLTKIVFGSGYFFAKVQHIGLRLYNFEFRITR